MTRIGFIGLGIMGMPLCRHLLQAGYELIVFNRSRDKVDILISEGAVRAESPRETAESSDFVILCVPDTPDVEAVVLGCDGVVQVARAGMVVIDHSTVSPETARRCAAALAQRGAYFLDAPVSGGEEGAKQGRLAIMVGGDRSAFQHAQSILQHYGTSIVHVGESGAGQVAKLVNQILVGAGLLAIAEGMTLAERSGVDPRRVIEAIRGGAAGSWVLEHRGPKMLASDYRPGFKSALHVKDLRLAKEAAMQTGTYHPLSQLIHQAFQSLTDSGHGELDHSALKQWIEWKSEEIGPLS